MPIHLDYKGPVDKTHDRRFFFNGTATTEIYTLSLHDALPISAEVFHHARRQGAGRFDLAEVGMERLGRSEEHTSELQSQFHLVCRLLLEKKKTNTHYHHHHRHRYLMRHTHQRPFFIVAPTLKR